MPTSTFKRSLLMVAACVVVLAAFSSAPSTAQAMAAQPLKPGQTALSLTLDGRERIGLIVVPRSYTGQVKVPLVVVLHGAGGNARNGLETGQWIEKSEKEGFIALSLQGLPLFPNQPESFATNPNVWRDGRASINASTGLRKVDDVAFVSAALDNVISRAAIDEDRIYVTGFSNGAGMAFRLGSDLSDRIAAIGPGSSHPQGTIGPLKRPVSMILFAGNEDPLNPFNGGIGKSPWGSQETPAFSSSFKAWADLLHCSGKPVEIYNKDGVTGSSYQGCDKGAEAQFYVVDGMGHAWAGGRSTLLKAIVGRSSDAIDETDVIWQFFVKHPRVAQQAVVAAS